MIPIRSSQWRLGVPHVVRGLIVLNVLVFVLMLTMNDQPRTAVLIVDGDSLVNDTPSRPVQYGSSARDDFTLRFGAVPELITGYLNGNSATHDFIEDNRFSNAGRTAEDGIGIDLLDGFLLLLTPLTAMFIHGGWIHLIGNMLFLWVFGQALEDRLGHWRFALFYLVSGYAAATAHIVIDASDLVPMIGASGAISGVLGAYLLLFPRAMIQVIVPLLLFIPVVVPAPLMIGFWFVLNVFSGISSIADQTSGSGGTAWFAHLGGFAAGFLLIYPFLIGRWKAPAGEIGPTWNLPPNVSHQLDRLPRFGRSTPTDTLRWPDPDDPPTTTTTTLVEPPPSDLDAGHLSQRGRAAGLGRLFRRRPLPRRRRRPGGTDIYRSPPDDPPP